MSTPKYNKKKEERIRSAFPRNFSRTRQSHVKPNKHTTSLFFFALFHLTFFNARHLETILTIKSCSDGISSPSAFATFSLIFQFYRTSNVIRARDLSSCSCCVHMQYRSIGIATAKITGCVFNCSFPQVFFSLLFWISITGQMSSSSIFESYKTPMHFWCPLLVDSVEIVCPISIIPIRIENGIHDSFSIDLVGIYRGVIDTWKDFVVCSAFSIRWHGFAFNS